MLVAYYCRHFQNTPFHGEFLGNISSIPIEQILVKMMNDDFEKYLGESKEPLKLPEIF